MNPTLAMINLEALIEARDFNTLREQTKNWSAGDLAELMEPLSAEKEAVIFRLLPREQAAGVFSYLSEERQEELLKAMAREDVANILNAMSPDDRTSLLEEMPANVIQHLLGLLSAEERTVASQLLGYEEDSVGRLMTPDFVRVRPQWTIAQALEHIRRYGKDSETMSMIYVIDDNNKLVDDLRIRQILLASPTDTVADLMDSRFVYLKTTDNRETAVEAFKDSDLNALPVTDKEDTLIGIVTVDDILDVAEEEATEDIQKMGGSEALDEPYMKIAISKMVQKRATWLIILFISEMLTATAMGNFEHEIAKAVVLSIFVPLVISSGGNSGSQASTLIIRAMALGEVRLVDWWRVMRREFLSGLSLGAILGVIGFIRISVWHYLFDAYGPHWFLLAVTVGIALVGIVLWGSLSGSMLPFLLKRVGLDPATSSAPFVATLVDVSGLIIYFTVAAVILKGTLL
ncbi:MAG TPA: magnesium transporter [Anaerolineales bacterium]|nr:magnesium transporter [Anaerolineales bacterium]HNE03532.1 magnesium transporter [Anaerolineales bacterium]HNF93067.1 magnesium transporter [Anaerolineales bacterium]HNO92555.1 magnesium transporter [Anaerolineales bacterium]